MDANDELKITQSPYWSAYYHAFCELNEVREQEKQLAIRKAHLKDTLSALAPLLFPTSKIDINSLNLSNAIRLVMSGSNRPLSAIEIRSKLTDLGFNLDQFSNPLASIHTALTRMGETNELTLVEKGDEKKKFMPGPEMKSIPETTGALVDPLTGLETPLDKVRKTVGQMMAERGAESRSENK